MAQGFLNRHNFMEWYSKSLILIFPYFSLIPPFLICKICKGQKITVHDIMIDIKAEKEYKQVKKGI